MLWKLSLIFITVISFCGCDPRYGMIEANFQLAQESRLPKWFSLPSNYSRKDVTMDITTYSTPSGEIVAKMVLRGPGPEHKVLSEKVGSKRMHPLTEQQGYAKYPLCSIITVDRIEEVFEQKRPEPIFYISDDPKYTSVLKQQKTPNK